MSIAIIDLDSVSFVAGHGIKLLDENNEPLRQDNKFVYRDKTEDELKEAVDTILSGILKASKATHYVGFIKGKNTISIKRSVNPEYKNDRKKESPFWWNTVKSRFIDQWKAIEVNDIEVDDAVNIARLSIKDSFICAIDSDILGLEGTHYNWKTFKWITTSKDQSKLKFWTDMITGTHNNTKGIPGRGEKFAEKILITERNPDCRTDREVVLNAYITHFEEYEGIKEFYKNYICCKTLDKYDGFIIPDPIEIEKEESNNF